MAGEGHDGPLVGETFEPGEPGRQRLPDREIVLAGQGQGELQPLVAAELAGDREGPCVVDEGMPLVGRARSGAVRRDRGPGRRAVGDAVEARGVGIGADQPARSGEHEPVGVEQDPVVDDLAVVLEAEPDGNRPTGAAGGRRIQGEVALGDADAVGGLLDLDERVAALVDPAVHHRADGRTADVLERIPQVAGLGVRVGMGLQVVAHAVTEDLGAQVLFEHANDRRALLVGQDVEHAFGFLGGDHRELDRTGAGERVGVECRGPGAGEGRPHPPVGAVGVAARGLHERREGLVEPDALPPLHRHEVAEPHVGELVVDHVGDDLELGLTRARRIDEEEDLAEGHAAEVLHGAEGEVGDGQEVDLVTGVGDVVVVGEPLEGMDGDVERERGQFGLPRSVHDAHRDAAGIDRFGDLQRTHDEGDEIGRHPHGLGEGDAAAAVGVDRGGGLGAVRDGEMVGIDHERDGEDRLPGRFVPAGEDPAGIGGLALGGGDRVLVAIVVVVGGPVETTEAVVEDPAEGEDDPGRPGAEVAGEGQVQPLGGLVETDVGDVFDRRGALAHDDQHAVDLELDRVAHDLVGRLEHLDVDCRRPAKARVVDVGLEHQVVTVRHHVGRKTGVHGSHPSNLEPSRDRKPKHTPVIRISAFMGGAGHSPKEFGMRNRHRRQEPEESFEPVDWPDAQLDLDDEAFAEAIAHGRGEELAA